MSEINGLEQGSTSSATGEFGFCENCGDVRPVVMPTGDRLQERLRRAFDKTAQMDGADVEEIANQLMQMGVDEIQAFGLLDHPHAPRLLVAVTAMMQALILIERKLERDLGEPVDLLRRATEGIERALEGDDG